MYFHNITTNDMLNGEGLRTVLWVSGCTHNCKGCHNPQTHNPNSGIPFTFKDYLELIQKIKQPQIEGITFSGGDPLHQNNIDEIIEIAKIVKKLNKTVWLYTGYTYEQIIKNLTKKEILKYIDVLVDGRFEINKKDIKYKYAGSTNQRLINVQETLKQNKIVLYSD